MDVTMTPEHQEWEAKLDALGTEATKMQYLGHLIKYPWFLEKSPLFRYVEGYYLTKYSDASLVERISYEDDDFFDGYKAADYLTKVLEK